MEYYSRKIPGKSNIGGDSVGDQTVLLGIFKIVPMPAFCPDDFVNLKEDMNAFAVKERSLE